MPGNGRAIKEVVIPLMSEKRDDGSYSITSPLVPMFHVVGVDEPTALATAMDILKDHLEQNFNIKVRAMRLTEGTRELFGDVAPTIPTHVIAELAA